MMAVQKIFARSLLIASLVILAMSKTVNAALSIQSDIITCFDSENLCKSNCSQGCYYMNSCNGSSGSMYACVSNTIIIIVACAAGVLLLLLVVTCVACCCCPCCCIAQCIKRKRDKELRQSTDSGFRVVMPVQQVSPNEIEPLPMTSKTVS
uniref:Uncharacterized protein n=1 Tax=Plectus sambesii TaxID=2011161 RepID=A0A914V9T5_9BILA